jgi:hypothetical protein
VERYNNIVNDEQRRIWIKLIRPTGSSKINCLLRFSSSM